MAKHPRRKARRSGGSREQVEPLAGEADAKELSSDNGKAVVSAVPVVGIGASAGGIEALSRFFDAMPANSGCAFVVVLHLDPKHESELARVLSAHTTMPVVQVKDGMQLVPDSVSVIAPDTDLKVQRGRLHVSKLTEPRGLRHPVDVLFNSLAMDRHERAVAIVLSGTGSNGTEGLKEIRAEGGMSLVQSPETAKFDGMPRSAIEADLADHILPPEKMPEVLLRYIHHGYVSAASAGEPAAEKRETEIEQVLDILRVRGGHDFSSYKRSTQQRRIHRRMGLNNIQSLRAYLDFLRANPDEVRTLAADLMISVTEFFRDTEAWEALRQEVIAPLVAERASGEAIRVWAPACSTGEEAYSIAMLVTEQAEAAGKRFDLKVFATDAQEENLRKARDGIYPAAATAGFPPERLQRFFEKLDGTVRVTKELRDMVVFAAQNLLRDPPFSRQDLISLRNCLIYLEPDGQQRIIALCHFALRPGGYLFLGNAETIGRHDDLFEIVSKKWRIYRRLGTTRHDLIDYPPSRFPNEPHPPKEASPPLAAQGPAEAARRALLELYAPASVLIDQKGRVLYFHGTTRNYLEQPSGEPTRDLLTMARDGLALKLRSAIREASRSNQSVTVTARIRQSASESSVTMTVVPLPPTSRESGQLLVSFTPEQAEPGFVETAAAREDAGAASPNERALHDEMMAIRSELRDTVENLETANEELKASNEEATSMNEELQSTNEELETSKEELQSFNEELNTVNHQLQLKIGELERATNDQENLLAGSETATLFLDDKFRIKWFSPATKELFDFASSDIGRPIIHLARKFSDENLLPDAETVLRKLTTIETEVRSDSGRWYLRRTLPYRTRDNRIDGVVITFVDITERKSADARESARTYAEAIVTTIQQPLLILDADLRVRSANPAFYDLFRVTPKTAEGSLIYEVGDRQWDVPELRKALENVLPKGGGFSSFRVVFEFPDLGQRTLMLNARKLSQEGFPGLILLAIEDMTAREQAEEQRRAQERLQTLSEIFEAVPVAIYTTHATGLITSYNSAATELWGRTLELGTERWCGSLRMYKTDGTPLPHEECPMAIAVKEGRALRGAEAVAERPDGVRVPFLAYPTPLRDNSGAVTGAVNVLVDATEIRRNQELRERLGAIVESSDDAILSKDLDGTITSWNKAAERLFGYPPEEIVGRSIMTLVPMERHEEEADILDRIRRGEQIQHYETARCCKDRSQVWVSLTASPLRNPEGEIVGASSTARDMTERRRAEVHRKILIGELNHRVKNVMATVQAVASQTLSSSASMDEARAAFGSRLIALGKAHDLLTRENWAGADLADIVAETVEPHSGGSNRFQIKGPSVRLLPSVALSIAMALHELATNAAKYGALSTEEGKVDVVWQLDGDGKDRRLAFRWTETDGPPVVPPTREGFGSRLVQRVLTAELRGKVHVTYEATGVVCTIDAPMPDDKNEVTGVDRPDSQTDFSS